jgi:surface protein
MASIINNGKPETDAEIQRCQDEIKGIKSKIEEHKNQLESEEKNPFEQYCYYSSRFNHDISEWNISNVNNMRYMFASSQ